MIAIILAIIIGVAPVQPHHEVCVVTEIEYVDSSTDLVIVSAANGNEFGFYADSHEYSAPDCVDVTFDPFGRIINAN